MLTFWSGTSAFRHRLSPLRPMGTNIFGPADAVSVRRRCLGRRTQTVSVLAPRNISLSYEHATRSALPNSCDIIVNEPIGPPHARPSHPKHINTPRLVAGPEAMCHSTIVKLKKAIFLVFHMSRYHSAITHHGIRNHPTLGRTVFQYRPV